jgi:cytochrome c biogenesis protein ResB
MAVEAEWLPVRTETGKIRKGPIADSDIRQNAPFCLMFKNFAIDFQGL